MGYAHYWSRPARIETETFVKILKDFSIIVRDLPRYGVILAGPDGTGNPILTEDGVSFNGSARCGHPPQALVNPRPTPDAGGVFFTPGFAGWHGNGHRIRTRMCPGRCDLAAFTFPRITVGEGGRIYGAVRTDFRPYDLAVTAFLIIARHHLGDAMEVMTDGEDPQWLDARIAVGFYRSYATQYRVEGGHLIRVAEGVAE